MFILITRIILILCAYLLVCAMGYLGLLTYQRNVTGWFLIVTALLYALSGPYLLYSHLKKEKVVRRERQDRSFWYLIPGFLVVYYAPPLEYLYLPEILPGTRTSWMQAVGIGLILVNLVLFLWARAALKSLYSGKLQVKVGHNLVKSGPYRIIRHPAYAAYILMGLGISIGFSSMIGFLAVILLLVPALVYRIGIEERLLADEFGGEFETFTSTTWRLIPGVW